MLSCEETTLQAPGGPRLHAWHWRPAGTPRANIVFLHGYDDHSYRYAATQERLAEAGYRVRAFDFRGHGRSEGQRGYCREWQEYLTDLATALAGGAGDEGRTFLVGQSHGALVAAHWGLARPETIAGLVLCSPYLRLVMPVPPLKLAMARTLNRLAPALRLGSEIRVEMLTRDPHLQQETRADRLISRVATPRWFCCSTAAQADLLARAPDLRLPTLTLHGGQDPIADPQAAAELHDRLGAADKTLLTYPDMRHETLRELGREQVWDDILAWLDARTD